MIQSFLRGKCSRESCYNCCFKQKIRLADFTLADYWGIEHIDPELNDEKGLSSVYVNSTKAEKVIEAIRGNVNLKEMELARTVSYNPAMIESEKLNQDRLPFLRDLRHKSFDMVAGKYNEKIGMGTKVRWTFRRILGKQVYEFIRRRFLGERNDT